MRRTKAWAAAGFSLATNSASSSRFRNAVASHLIRTCAPLAEYLPDKLIAGEIATISLSHRLVNFPELPLVQINENLYGFLGE